MVTNIYLTPIMLQVSILCEVIPTVPVVTKLNLHNHFLNYGLLFSFIEKATEPQEGHLTSISCHMH